MTTFVLESKSTNTKKSYLFRLNRKCTFIKDHGNNNLPPDPIHIALYITHLMDTQCSLTVINIVIHAIKWAHVLNGIFRSN
jgi:hypothetical protein